MRDLFSGPHVDGRKLAARLSVLAMVVNTAPMIAPSFGALLLGLTGWRGIYGLLAALGALSWILVTLFLPETRPAAARTGKQPLLGGLAILRHHPATLAHVAVYGISFSAVFAYIASSSLLLMGYFRASRYHFALMFAATALGIVSGAFLSGRLAGRVSGRRLILTGLGCILAGAGVLALSFAVRNPSLPLTLACLMLATFGNGLINPAASRGALTARPEIAGLIGALLATGQMSFCALSSFTAALLINDFGVATVPLVMLAFAALAGTLYTLGTRRR